MRVDAVEFINIDLCHLRWANKLGVVWISTIFPTNPSLMKTIGDKTISQNIWVYDLVTEIVSPKHGSHNKKEKAPDYSYT